MKICTVIVTARGVPYLERFQLQEKSDFVIISKTADQKILNNVSVFTDEEVLKELVSTSWHFLSKEKKFGRGA